MWSCAADSSGGPPTGAAGGDLTGTYPAPQIGPNAVGAGEVADNSLTGNDINEATLSLPGTDAYYSSGGPGQQFGLAAGQSREVDALNLPAGNFTLAASLDPGGWKGDSIGCWFSSGGEERIAYQPVTYPEEYTIPNLDLIGVVSLTAPGKVGVICQSGGFNEGNNFFGNWTLLATKVTNLHRQ